LLTNWRPLRLLDLRGTDGSLKAAEVIEHGMTMKSPPCPLSPQYAPKIEVTHPNVPEGSQEQLLDDRTQSPPYHGQDNPVFTFDTASLFYRAPSRVDRITAPSAEPSIHFLPPLRHNSFSPFQPATDKDSLMVPDIARERSTAKRTYFILVLRTLRRPVILSGAHDLEQTPCAPARGTAGALQTGKFAGQR
ncbi:hypothetical protein BaRGS_00033742, partial [Batillaria attramentaria]